MASNKRGLRWSSLISQLFVLFIVPLTGLVLVIAIGSTRLHADAMREMAGSEGLRAARATASTLAEQVHHREQSLISLALRARDGVPAADLLSTSDFLLNDFDGGVAFYDRSGKLLSASDRYQLAQNAPEQIDAFLRSLPLLAQTPAILSTDLVRPDSQGDPLYVMAARIQPDLEIVGAFSPARLARQTVGSIYGGTQATVLLVNANRQVLFENDLSVEDTDLASRPGVADALRGDSGVAYLPGSPTEIVVAFTPVGSLGWGLVAEEPWQAIASPFLQTTQLAPLTLIPVLLLTLIILWFAASQIIQPLRRLETQTAGLANEQYQRLDEPVGGIFEIRNLQASLRQMGQKVRATQKTLHSYIGAITRGQENERRRLARELHDETLQSVIALNQRVQLVRLSLHDRHAADALKEIQASSEETMSNLRRMLRGLRPVYLEDRGLEAALEVLTRETSETLGIPIQFTSTGEQHRFVPETELALYRMAQEALNNVAHHSQAEHAWVDVAFSDAGVCLTICDDGRGFEVPEDTGEFTRTGHFGLLGLSERAELIGARLSVDSAPGKGTCIKIEVDGEKAAVNPVIDPG